MKSEESTVFFSLKIGGGGKGSLVTIVRKLLTPSVCDLRREGIRRGQGKEREDTKWDKGRRERIRRGQGKKGERTG